jgi:hypothetical protein
MAQKNRAQMLIDITSNIFNNVINYITGQNAQDRFVNLLDSSPNIISDKDQANGYVGLDGNGAMFSSYYNENISRADLQTLLTNNLAVGYKFYQINDAVGASKIILVCADSNITLYQFGIDANTGEIGTYDIVTDSFNPIVSTGNANIVYITNAALITLGSTSGISTTTFYVVTDAVAGQLLTKGKTSTTIDDGVLNLDTGESGTYVLATDTFTVATPNLQQVLDAGNISTTGFRIEDGAGNEVTIADYYVQILNPLGGVATITSPTLDEGVSFELPDKTAGTEIFAMLSDLTGLVASVNSGININVDNTDPANPIINSLSDRYKTSSLTSNTIGNGSKSFTVDLNLSYIPLQEVLVVYDVSNHMHGSVTSYNPATGALVVDIKHNTGSGTYTLWSINLDGTPVDAITGSGTANRLAYFTAAQVIDDLDTATYPSLTELSYVKGVGSQVVGTTDTNTLTNKRITARTGTVASSATPTINTDNVDFYSITALATAITSMTTNLSGTPTDAQTLWIAITDNGTARAITWGASFEASTIALPTTTVISTRLDVAFIWNTATSRWRCVGVA